MSEVGTIQIEFQSISDRSNDKNDEKYGNSAREIFRRLDPFEPGGPKLPIRGHPPILIDPRSGRFRDQHISWGALGDSYFEYLLKFWIYEGLSHMHTFYISIICLCFFFQCKCLLCCLMKKKNVTFFASQSHTLKNK